MKHGPHWLLRRRSLVILLLPALVAAVLLATDPDKGWSVAMWALKLTTLFVIIAFAHASDKGVFDYDEADRQTFFRRAGNDPTGSGLALIARAITYAATVIAAVLLVHGGVGAQPVPANCLKLHPLVVQETQRRWPAIPEQAYPGALIEHESCVTLSSPRCCNPLSRLKTSREEGAGVGQITRAYRADGTLRFDSLADMRAAHPALAAWSWENVYQRADLQVAALILQSHDNFALFARLVPSRSALLFADASYNQGAGRTQADRRRCAMTAGCDPRQWFGNVERTCTASHAALYGVRSPCDISRHHVADVINARVPRYRGLT